MCFVTYVFMFSMSYPSGIGRKYEEIQTSLVAQLVKNLPLMQETLVQFLGQKDPHSSMLGLPWWLRLKNLPAMQETQFDPWVGKIPGRRARLPTPVFLPGESPWTEEPLGLQSLWLQRVGHD